MPSFDIVNQLDMQEVDNAVNITKKMIATRFDFRKSKSEATLHRKEGRIHILTEDTMKMKAIEGELITSLSKRGIDAKALVYKDVEQAAGDMIKRDIDIIQGIESDIAKKIVKMIKARKLKVQAKIMEDQVRVSGKKIDDLQEVISMFKAEDMGVPLQYVNMKS
ncbi:MAG: YajQ family cyclic di-GMP-binding protein [Thermoleophilia bacterium]